MACGQGGSKIRGEITLEVNREMGWHLFGGVKSRNFFFLRWEINMFIC